MDVHEAGPIVVGLVLGMINGDERGMAELIGPHMSSPDDLRALLGAAVGTMAAAIEASTEDNMPFTIDRLRELALSIAEDPLA